MLLLPQDTRDLQLLDDLLTLRKRFLSNLDKFESLWPVNKLF